MALTSPEEPTYKYDTVQLPVMPPKTPSVAISANTSWYLFNFRANTIRMLLKHGYKVYAISPNDAFSKQLTALGCEHISIAIDQGGTNPINDAFTAWSFFKIYRRIKPSVILNFTPKNNIYSTLAGNWLNIPCINNIAGLGLIFTRKGVTTNIVKTLYKASQPKAAHIFFQNDEDRELFLKAGIVDIERTSRIPGSGVDLKRFAPVGPKNDGKTTFILVARLLREKGIAEYVKAAGILHNLRDDVKFQLLGQIDPNNPSAITLEELSELNSSQSVEYLGTSSEVEKIVANVDCVVLPSYYREGVPKSLLEGGAMAKPIITTDNIGCRETVKNGVTGYLCEPKNVESLVEKMSLIASMSAEQRNEMGRLSRSKIESEFDENIVLTAYLKAIRSALEESS